MKHNVTLKEREKAFIAICLLLFLACSIYLLVDFLRMSPALARARDAVGTAVFVRNDVRTRDAAGTRWEALKPGGKIFDRSAIETGASAAAGILLDDGTMVDLCAESLMTVEGSDTETRVSIVRGCGGIDRTGVQVDRERRLVVAQDEHLIAVDDTNLTIDRGPDGRPEIFINRGEATVDTKGTRRTIQPGERAILDRDAVSVEKKRLVLREPAYGRRFFTKGEAADLEFTWSYSGTTGGTEPYLLEISDSREFSRIVKRTRQESAYAAVSLPPGRYFWRVTAREPVANTAEQSGTGSFSITRDGPIFLVSPADGEILDYTAERPFVVFSWEPHPIASAYRLQLSDREDFSRIIGSIDTRVVNLTYQWERELKTGDTRTFFWRVTAIRDLPGWGGAASDTRSFSVQKTGAIKPPQLVSPADRRRIYRPRADREHVIFSWERTEDILERKIYFSKDRNFGSIYREMPVDRNYWTMERSFPAGTYYWRVGLSDPKTGKRVLSGYRSFVMQDYDDIALIEPEDEARFEAGDGAVAVTFRWKKPEGPGRYVVELSRESGIDPVAEAFPATQMTATGRDIPAGTHYWRVKMVDENDNILAASEARSFTVEEGLPAPVIISPRSGKRVDMSGQDELAFLWKPSRGASSYLMELHQTVGERTKRRDRLVASAQVDGSRYAITDMDMLDVGSFYWTLRALEKDRGGRIIRASKKQRSDFRISVLGGSKVIIISPKIQVIDDEKRK